MPRGTFVIFRLDRFPPPDGRKTYKTAEKRPRGSHDNHADPVFTSITLHDDETQPEDLYSKANVTHRKGVRIEGMWHGHVITEVVAQKKFDCYFSRERRLFIAEVDKEVALSAAEALSTDDVLRELFSFRRIELDFTQITPRAINVIGAWFKGMQYTNIRTQAAFGNQITVDPEFTRMAQHGNQSNLVVVLDHAGTHVKVNVSKVGSTFFLDDQTLETCLGFMEGLLAFERVVNPNAAPPGNNH